MWKTFLFPICLLWSSFTSAQLAEDFEDGDYTKDPEWYGDTALWHIKEGKLNSNYILKKGDPQVSYSLSTSSKRVKKTSWEFWVKTGPTSKNNLIRVFLSSQNKIPRENKPDEGYFLEIGNTADHVALYKKDSLEYTLLVEGRANITEHAELKIKIICDGNYRWRLFTDVTASGRQYFPEGSAVDSTFTRSNYFSFVIFQKGKTANQSHWFDDVFIKPYVPDKTPPSLREIITRDNHLMWLYFSKPLSPALLKDFHFLVDNRKPDSIRFLPESGEVLTLYFKEPFQSKKRYSLEMNNLSDLWGNTLDTSATFTYFTAGRFDVVFSEIYPDPTSSHGLPEHEFVELYNSCNFPVSLQGWQFCDKTRCAVFPDVVLRPDSLLIVCKQGHENAFFTFGKALGLRHFPTLNNDGDDLYLKNERGKIIDQVFYSKESYGDKDKAKGGWSLELQYVDYPCLLAGNWAASKAKIGGSPGQVNKNTGNKPHLKPVYVAVIDSLHLMLQCNAKLPEGVAKKAVFTLDDANILHVKQDSLNLHQLHLWLSEPLKKKRGYTLRIHELENCGMDIDEDGKMVFGVPEPASMQDIYLNEVLFNPVVRGSEFVELYNASDKIIDLSTIHLANKRNGEIEQIYTAATYPYYLFPHQYAAVTKNKDILLQQYFSKYPKNIVEAEKLPSYPNMEGTVVLLNRLGEILDEFNYSEGYHYDFFHVRKGVSLEKMNPVLPSGNFENWMSASSVNGYATPGYRNSQFVFRSQQDAYFNIKPKTFSPDGDGYQDQTFLNYTISTGYSAKIKIYNEYGLPVRRLGNNIFLGTKGKIPWDGRDNQGNILPTGIYILYINLYHPSGKTHIYKLPVVLVKRK